MKKQERQLKRIVNKNLDNIYKTAYGIARDWDKKTIPLTTLDVIIDKSRPSVNTGEENVDLFNTNYNRLLDSLSNACKKIAKKMDSKSIPVEQVKQGINILKKGFSNGLSGIG